MVKACSADSSTEGGAMTRPKIVDTFPFNNELDLLECRLTELYDAVDKFVIVEATVDHQDHVKPLHYQDNKERFAAFADKIVHVVAQDMPTITEDNDPWAREHAQRESIAIGLVKIGVDSSDIVLQSDVDEIPDPFIVRNIRPTGLCVFEQRLHCFAIDWEHPSPWYGTVAATVQTLGRFKMMPFSFMRDARLSAPCPPHLRNAGHHFSWLGGNAAQQAKVNSFCHPEILLDGEVRRMLNEDAYYRFGWHVDGTRQKPCEVDETYPRWIRDGHAPANWYRPTETV